MPKRRDDCQDNPDQKEQREIHLEDRVAEMAAHGFESLARLPLRCTAVIAME